MLVDRPVSATRFLLLPRRGTRQSFLFSDLNQRHLSAMTMDAWSSLEPEIVNGQRSLLDRQLRKVSHHVDDHELL
ncbi:MAG: hypothetical protein ACI8RZ_007306 [Myxococcota bacterium]|jgi:hypothetical protein